MLWKNKKNMDQVLVNKLLQLIQSNYKAEFNLQLQMNPNMEFGDVFQYFVTKYSHVDKYDCAKNKATMN